MNTIVEQIIVEKKKSLEKLKAVVSEEQIKIKAKAFKREVRSFKEAIAGKETLSLIAEVKKASPSKGIIRPDFNPVEIAKIYQAKGAQAVSVLTEENFFKGSLEYLKQVRQAINLPILRKDFILEPYQIYESYLAGADCVLLIAKILSQDELAKLFDLAKGLGLDVLLEVHDDKELKIALKINAEIIGVNNRNLDDFTVDISLTQQLLNLIPKDKIIVSESGISSSQDIKYLKSIGVDAALIGEAFLKEQDIGKAIDRIWG